jgi:hypothetical protein
MEKTFLLGPGNGSFSLKAQRLLNFALGFMFIAQGAFSFARESPFSLFTTLLAFAQILGGCLFLFFGFSMMSKSSRFAPKVKLNNDHIEFRLGFFQANVSIKWHDVRAIDLRSYGMTFRLAESNRAIDYKTSPKISIEVKEAIREFAEAKGIVVAAG